MLGTRVLDAVSTAVKEGGGWGDGGVGGLRGG